MKAEMKAAQGENEISIKLMPHFGTGIIPNSSGSSSAANFLLHFATLARVAVKLSHCPGFCVPDAKKIK